jgi:acyl carrier protein
MTHIEETIRHYIQDSYLSDGRAPESAGDELSSDQDLLAILDSLQVLRMLLDLEAEYSIKIENSELTPENLGSIRRLAELIARKRQEAMCSGLPS